MIIYTLLASGNTFAVVAIKRGSAFSMTWKLASNAVSVACAIVLRHYGLDTVLRCGTILVCIMEGHKVKC